MSDCQQTETFGGCIEESSWSNLCRRSQALCDVNEIPYLPPMKLLFTQARTARAGGADDNLGRGMETALLLAFFLGIGWLLDQWLGTRPLFMIGLVLFGAAGSFVKMKFDYDSRMDRLEEERRNASASRASK